MQIVGWVVQKVSDETMESFKSRVDNSSKKKKQNRAKTSWSSVRVNCDNMYAQNVNNPFNYLFSLLLLLDNVFTIYKLHRFLLCSVTLPLTFTLTEICGLLTSLNAVCGVFDLLTPISVVGWVWCNLILLCYNQDQPALKNLQVTYFPKHMD